MKKQFYFFIYTITMIEIHLENISFDSAHFLPDYDGKCSRLHGHTYKVEVSVCGDQRNDGMVIDFAELKKIVKEIVDELDHRLLLPGLYVHGRWIEKDAEKSMLKYCFNVRTDQEGKIEDFSHIEIPWDFCKILAGVSETTVENLAKYIHKSLKKYEVLKGMHVSVKIRENDGNSAAYCECENFCPN